MREFETFGSGLADTKVEQLTALREKGRRAKERGATFWEDVLFVFLLLPYAFLEFETRAFPVMFVMVAVGHLVGWGTGLWRPNLLG